MRLFGVIEAKGGLELRKREKKEHVDQKGRKKSVLLNQDAATNSKGKIKIRQAMKGEREKFAKQHSFTLSEVGNDFPR